MPSSRKALIRARPAASRSWSVSSTTTCRPESAMTWAMPAPMVPKPSTATFAMSIDCVIAASSSGPEEPGVVVGVEAPSGLAAEVAGGDHAGDHRRRIEARVPELLVEPHGHLLVDVHADDVQEPGWAHRVAERTEHGGVDLLLGRPAVLKGVDAGVLPRNEAAVDDEPGPVLGDDRGLADGVEELDGGLVRPRRGVTTVGDLDQLHQRSRVAVVGPDDPLRQAGARGDAGDRERRRVGVEERGLRDDVVQLTEEVPLQSEVLENGLDDDVAGGQPLELRGAFQRLLGGLRRRGVELAELDGLVEEGVDVLDAPPEVGLVDVEQQDPVPAPGGHGGDPGTHGSRAEDADDLLVVAHPSLPLARGRGTAGPRGRADLDVKVRRPPYARWSRCPPPRSQRLLRARGRAADQQSLDLIGPVVDLRDLRVPEAPLHAESLEVAEGAEDPRRFDGRPEPEIGADLLHDADLVGRHSAVLVDLARHRHQQQ